MSSDRPQGTGNKAVTGEATIWEIVLSWLRLIVARRVVFIIVLALVFVLSAAVALLLPPRFVARGVILPPSSNAGMTGMLSNLSALTGLGSLGAGDGGADLYPVVARSRCILSAVLDKPYGDEDIRRFLLENEEPDSLNLHLLMETLRSDLQARKNLHNNTVTISYGHRDKYFAAALVNGVLDEMDAYFRSGMETEFRNQRQLIEQRLPSVQDSLSAQENELLRFREKNRDTSLSPRLRLEEARLMRQVTISGELYRELVAQYELAKIQEVGSTPVLKVLDRAAVPLVRDWPQRTKIVLSCLVLAFVITFLVLKLGPERR